MKRQVLVSAIAAVALVGGLLYSCSKEVSSTGQDSLILKKATIQALVSAPTPPNCEANCIAFGSNEFFPVTNQTVISWGGSDNNKSSKTVDIQYYNTETDFVLKVKSTEGWSDLVIDNVSSWTDGPVTANEWGTYTKPLPKGWKACDPIAFALKITGNGPQAEFQVAYNLIGICHDCIEDFSYVNNNDGTFTFTYKTGAEDISDAHLVLTFAQAETITITPTDGEIWLRPGKGNAQNMQADMDLLACHTYSWKVKMVDCTASNNTANGWTDFTVNGDSKKNENTPNITYTCPN